MSRTRAFVALGSNLRPRSANLNAALEHLGRIAEVTAVSSYYLTEAVPERGVRSSDPDFLNAAVAIETDLNARGLLTALLTIETNLGRDRSADPAGPRQIDLDLLLFGNTTVNQPGVVVPHPRMHRRRFVLEPLSEIAPAAWHPGLRKTVVELRAAVATRHAPEPEPEPIRGRSDFQ